MAGSISRPPIRTSRRSAWPRWTIPAVIGAVILICGLALCGMNLSDPPHHDKSAAAPAAGTNPGSTGGQPASGQPPAPNSAVVPDLVGLNAAVAEDQLKKLGFKNIKFASGDKRYRMVIVVENWSVKGQSATAGSRLDKSTLIVLTCVKPS